MNVCVCVCVCVCCLMALTVIKQNQVPTRKVLRQCILRSFEEARSVPSRAHARSASKGGCDRHGVGVNTPEQEHTDVCSQTPRASAPRTDNAGARDTVLTALSTACCTSFVCHPAFTVVSCARQTLNNCTRPTAASLMQRRQRTTHPSSNSHSATSSAPHEGSGDRGPFGDGAGRPRRPPNVTSASGMSSLAGVKCLVSIHSTC